MNFSARFEYSIWGLIELGARYHRVAGRSSENPMQIGSIARKYGIPEKYLLQAMIELKKKGIIGAVKGRKGGYYLKQKPADINLAEVFQVIDGTDSDSCPAKLKICRANGNCPLHPVFRGTFGKINDYLRTIKLADIIKLAPKSSSEMYYI